MGEFLLLLAEPRQFLFVVGLLGVLDLFLQFVLILAQGVQFLLLFRQLFGQSIQVVLSCRSVNPLIIFCNSSAAAFCSALRLLLSWFLSTSLPAVFM